MENINAERLVAHHRNPFLSLFVFILLFVGSLIVGSGIAQLFMSITTGINQHDLLLPGAAIDLSLQEKYSILINQGLISLITFLLPPVLFFTLYNKCQIRDLISTNYQDAKPYLVGGLILLSFFVVNSFFIDLNESMKLPESMATLEKAIRDLEDQLKALTKILTSFETPTYFLVSIVVVAVLPAIGEELIFRGLLQNIFRQIFRNYHVAIWVAAFIFSAIHFQFYGFLPRMLLGALFGYLYVWSGNILLPMLAHFLNNFLSLALLYVYQLNLTDVDIESSEAPPVWVIGLFTSIFIFLMYYFYRYFSELNRKNGKLEKGV